MSHLVREEELFLTSGRVSPSVLFRASTDWVWPTHIGEHNLLYSVNLSKC